MNKLFTIVAILACATAINLRAEDKEKPKMSKEQKALRKEIAGKYDTNKDGKLDKEERAKISKEDQEKMEKAGIAHKKKDKSS